MSKTFHELKSFMDQKSFFPLKKKKKIVFLKMIRILQGFFFSTLKKNSIFMADSCFCIADANTLL